MISVKCKCGKSQMTFLKLKEGQIKDGQYECKFCKVKPEEDFEIVEYFEDTSDSCDCKEDCKKCEAPKPKKPKKKKNGK